jgi:predicted HicB family RNase H-like nuclease
MTGKKIEFSKKPTLKETNQFIDNWVSGNPETKDLDKRLKRTTIYMPEELHKKLKVQAASTQTSMTDIIINTLKDHIK